MNILLINHYAGSPQYGMEFRPYYLAKEWIKQGHSVTILAASYSHLRTSQPIIHGEFHIETIEGVRYIWLKTPAYNTSGIKRILNMLNFIVKLFWYGYKIKMSTNPDIVIASSTYPLDIYPAHRIAQISSAKLVFELHDLWPLSPMLIGGYSKKHPFIWMMQKAENFACKNSDYFVSLLANAKDYLKKHGLNERRFVHIPNGFSLEETNNKNDTISVQHKDMIDSIRQKYKLLIGYAGGIAPSNAMKTLVDAACFFKEDNNLAFVIVGNGSQKSELNDLSESRNQKNTYFLSPVPKRSIPDLLERFDFLYAGGTKSILHSYGTSFNKITDYMLAEKPIIFAVDEPNSIVVSVGCGIQIPAENETELVKTIQLFSNMSFEERMEMGKKGREYALKELNYSALSKKFLDAINQS